MNRTGFTLIEILIVLVIIGLLAAIAIPKFGNTKEKAFIASMKSDLRNLVTAEEAYFADSTAYTEQTDCNTAPAPGRRVVPVARQHPRQAQGTSRWLDGAHDERQHLSGVRDLCRRRGSIPAGEAVGSRGCAGLSIGRPTRPRRCLSGSSASALPREAWH